MEATYQTQDRKFSQEQKDQGKLTKPLASLIGGIHQCICPDFLITGSITKFLSEALQIISLPCPPFFSFPQKPFWKLFQYYQCFIRSTLAYCSQPQTTYFGASFIESQVVIIIIIIGKKIKIREEELEEGGRKRERGKREEKVMLANKAMNSNVSALTLLLRVLVSYLR